MKRYPESLLYRKDFLARTARFLGYFIPRFRNVSLQSEWYGTERVKKKSKESLLKQFKRNIRELYGLFDEEKSQKLVDLLEILKFSDENFPYLVVLRLADNLKIESVHLHKDPHYEDLTPDGLIGKPIVIPNLIEIKYNPEYMKKIGNILLGSGKGNTVAIGGTKDHFLVIGHLKAGFIYSNPPLLISH